MLEKENRAQNVYAPNNNFPFHYQHVLRSYGFIFVSNRKSGDVQSAGHCRLQISAATAQFRPQQGEDSAPLSTCENHNAFLFFMYLLLRGIAPSETR